MTHEPGGQVRVMSSMRKVHLICSLLMAFCVSIVGIGCDGGKPAPSPAPKMTGEAPKDAKSTKKTGPKKKGSGNSSTTGGGVEVPPAGGTTETPAEAKPEEKKVEEAKPEEAKPEEAKTEEKKAE
jgi:hypothetical protein